MPLEPIQSITSNRVRVRDNQRRARARQREYVQDLEKKIQQYERKGVEATMEVQTAARGVVEENGRLRSESMRLQKENAELRGLLEAKVDQLEKKSGCQGSLAYDGSPAPSVQPSQGTCQGPVSPPASHETPSTATTMGDDTSSCEYAAHIITSMRADINAEDVRAELGCDTGQGMESCKVDNSKLFQAMDRYTG